MKTYINVTVKVVIESAATLDDEEVDDIVNEMWYDVSPADHHEDIKFIHTEITDSEITKREE